MKTGAERNDLLDLLPRRVKERVFPRLCEIDLPLLTRHHHIDQQLARWLLLSLDRLPDNKLTMTQELIANMLGVRREGVTEAARKLQEAGVIRYQRGHITVLDRPKLEEICCECYAVDK